MYEITSRNPFPMHVLQLLVNFISKKLPSSNPHFFFQTFSNSIISDRGAPNCLLSDIYQRDLLAEVDYISDPDSWLFAWDNYNPKCVAIAASDPNYLGSDGNGLDNRGPYGERLEKM